MTELFFSTQGELNAAGGFLIGGLLTLVGGIVSSLIGFYLGAKQTHAQHVEKVAEFRQQWINSLRDDLAAFNAIGVTPKRNPEEDLEFYRIGTRIELLIDSRDDDYDALHKIMYEYLQASDKDVPDKYRINPNFVKISQTILKREWERLKKDVREKRI